MRAIVCSAPGRSTGRGLWSYARRGVAALGVVVGCSAAAAADATAYTLRLAFPDGQPMTHGSACAGLGCMQRGDHVEQIDDNGEATLPGSRATIEYRRDGIALGKAPAGVASGSVVAVGDRVTVVLPHLLIGSAPQIDASESDLVARLNEARAREGLPLAQINPRLSAAADMQATWLATTGVAITDPDRFHEGPFQSDLSFRKGEVSMPAPATGGEIAQAGGTVEDTVSDWMSSPGHREQVLLPGKVLIGAARVGSFTIVQVHRPCDGCAQEGTGSRGQALPAPPPAAPPPPPTAAPTIGSSAAVAPRPTCGREQLAARRLRSSRGLVRLRIATSCLRPGSRYTLVVRQGTSGRLLRTVRIRGAGLMTVRLRPGRTVNRLRMKLKRDGAAVVARTMSLRT